MTASRSQDSSVQGGLQNLAATFAALNALEERLAEVEFDLTGRTSFDAPKQPDTDQWNELELVPRMAATVLALAELTQTLRQGLDSISNTLARPNAEPAEA